MVLHKISLHFENLNTKILLSNQSYRNKKLVFENINESLHEEDQSSHPTIIEISIIYTQKKKLNL